jgi:hypothetical protein
MTSPFGLLKQVGITVQVVPCPRVDVVFDRHEVGGPGEGLFDSEEGINKGGLHAMRRREC